MGCSREACVVDRRPDARRFGAVAYQNRVMLSRLSAMVIDGEQSEDCLTLNVWTPALDGKRRPVMSGFTAAGFTIGAGSQGLYDGSVLARPRRGTRHG